MFTASTAHRRWRRGRRPVSDIIRQLSERLQGSAVRRVPGAPRDLPLLCQHLQFLADQDGPARCRRQRLRLHADRGVAAERQHWQVQRVHEGVRGRRRRTSPSTHAVGKGWRGGQRSVYLRTTLPASHVWAWTVFPVSSSDCHQSV